MKHVIRPSDEFSRRIARNIQIMMQSEFNFTQTVDPVGGSWYVEPLTEEFSTKAWKKFQEVESEGGLALNLKNGKVQEAVNIVLEKRFSNLAKRKDRAVGNNMYPNMTEELLTAPEVDFNKIKADRLSELNENAHVIGINSIKGEYKSLVVKLLEELASYDREDIMLVISGHIEAHNIKEMYELGVSVVLVDNCYEKFAKGILSGLETILF